VVGLEIFVEPLREVPDRTSWLRLRDLADLAAAIPALDHDLSQALLPWLKDGPDLAVPYAMLTHPGHDAVRVCSTEIRSRVPAAPPSLTLAPLNPAALGRGELDTAMDRYVRSVLDRASELSMGDLRAVTRLLQFGGMHAAVVLERAQPALSGAGDAAAAFRQAAPLAAQLWDCPAKTLGPEHLDVVRGSADLLARMVVLAAQERALPGGAGDVVLRRLAAPALEFARHVPNLARAVEIGVRESLAAGLMLVPSVSVALWVPAGRGSGRGCRHGPPVVQLYASDLAAAAEGVAPVSGPPRRPWSSIRCGPSTRPARPRPWRAAMSARPVPRPATRGPRAEGLHPAAAAELTFALAPTPGTGRAGVWPRPLIEAADRRPESHPDTFAVPRPAPHRGAGLVPPIPPSGAAGSPVGVVTAGHHEPIDW